MAVTKPQQFNPTPTGDQAQDHVQQALNATTEAVRRGPPPRQLVTGLNKNKPDQGVVFKPGQIVDIPHSLGKTPTGFNIAKVVTNTPQAGSAPYASPNLQVVQVTGPLGQKIMRLRYVAPTKYTTTTGQNEELTDSVRLHLELF